MGQFSQSIRKSVDKISQEINDQIINVASTLFTGIVNDTPVLTGLLKNNWFTAVNSLSSSVTSTTDPSGGGSLLNISSLTQSEPFLNKDGMVSLSNNLDYSYRAESMGWPSPEWSGRVGPYRMVEINLIIAANKDYK